MVVLLTNFSVFGFIMLLLLQLCTSKTCYRERERERERVLVLDEKVEDGFGRVKI
jgi:hypothetical protein